MTNSFDWDRYQQTQHLLSARYKIPKIQLDVFNSLNSTNQKLWQLINTGVELPFSAIALQQTAGQGQWGKTWQSETGGLYLSLGLECNLALENSFHLIMATATGVTHLLRSYQLPITIKWSNDLILENRKLGGIKIETKSKQQIIKYAVVGIGINWSNLVPELGINLTSYYLNQQKRSPNNLQIKSLEELAAITIVGILKGYQNYLERGINYLHQEYLQLLNSISKPITLNNQSGTIIGVTSQGKLQVRLQSPGAKTEISFAPGEISLGYDS